ncbi:hypothetical protein LBMAG21_15950 [Armatimonadota bacterium]|nr:hypothetical protein LBMAG21_15950 [Armatimonadota bacterium]
MSTYEKTARRLTVLEPEQPESYPTAIVRQRGGSDAPSKELDSLKQVLAKEQRAVVVQKAGAEQARRSNACLRVFARTLIQNMNQPCFQVDSENRVVEWNTGMILWTEVGDQSAVGKDLHDVLPEFVAERLLGAITSAEAQAQLLTRLDSLTPVQGTLTREEDFESISYTAIPLLKVPGCVEGCVILLDIL